MKKLFFFAALLAATLCATAQQNQVIWQNGKVMYGSPIPTVDSITFAAELESSDTLHLILPRTIIVHDTVIKEVIVEVHDTIYQCPPDPYAPLAGVFSVSADKQVNFSKGNLQCTIQGTDTAWTFAANQYDIIGTANIVDGALADKIDMFGWSAKNTTAPWGISTSMSSSNYYGEFADWGQNVGDGTTWRTLTDSEWVYVVSGRTDASSKIGVARINLDEAGTTYANGLILLPDNWTDMEVTFKSGFSGTDSEQAYADYQTFTLDQWEKLEAAGAVFLPAAGYRDGSRFYYGERGFYWSATAPEEDDLSDSAYGLDFRSNRAYYWYTLMNCWGQSVRLVQDL
ncbi:MAG: hypothetical protein ACI4BD_04590 [Paludibacteraceae bacterium]